MFTDDEEAELADRLSTGSAGLSDAVFWLAALVAHRRGVPLPSFQSSDPDDPMTPQEATEIMQSAYDHIANLSWSAERIDHDIRITKEHLRRGGIRAEEHEGRAN